MKSAIGAAAASVCISVVATACASLPMVGGRGHSGFHDDYSVFEDDPTLEKTLVYFDPSADLSRYNRVIVDPCVVYLRRGAESTAVHPDGIKKFADSCHDAIVRNLEGAYKVVTSAGRDVLRLRVAITNVEPGDPEGNLLTKVPPPDAIIHNFVSYSGEPPEGETEVVLEAKLLDSVSGDLLAGLVAEGLGPKSQVWTTASQWNHVDQAFDRWGKRLRARLDEAHGR